MSKVYFLKSVQHIPASIDDVWNFFTSPDNLKSITPSNFNLRIISTNHGNSIFTGQIIEYKVSPLLGIPLYWMTQITEVNHKQNFTDEQRQGPYSLWKHRHSFRAIDGGVEMTDEVNYKLPLSFLGSIAHRLFVKKQIDEIFKFRFAKTEEAFGKWK